MFKATLCALGNSSVVNLALQVLLTFNLRDVLNFHLLVLSLSTFKPVILVKLPFVSLWILAML
jgi:hypothetical protein